MTKILGWMGCGLMAFSALGIGLLSLRYAIPGVKAQPEIAAKLFALPWLAIHAVTAATALILGAFQFLRRGHRRPAALAPRHRRGLCRALPRLVADRLRARVRQLRRPDSDRRFRAARHPQVRQHGGGAHAVLNGRYAAHGRWMMRSYALTFAAVTLRLCLAFLPALAIDFVTGYRAIAFLSWVPNFLIVEAVLWSRRPGRTIAALDRSLLKPS